jgi:hypothetical protein
VPTTHWKFALLLVDTHIVGIHLPRKDAIVDALLSAPIAADDDVEDQELGLRVIVGTGDVNRGRKRVAGSGWKPITRARGDNE